VTSTTTVSSALACPSTSADAVADADETAVDLVWTTSSTAFVYDAAIPHSSSSTSTLALTKCESNTTIRAFACSDEKSVSVKTSKTSRRHGYVVQAAKKNKLNKENAPTLTPTGTLKRSGALKSLRMNSPVIPIMTPAYDSVPFWRP
jgi:hypothetical protein